MTLGFKQQFPWATKDSPAPTNFREKILYGVGRSIWITPRQIKKYPKIHTMRADPTNRWKAGRKIEMVYRGAGYKIIDHFNKGIPELEVCTGVQKVEIKWRVNKDFFNRKEVDVFVDKRLVLECSFNESFIGATHHYSRGKGIIEISSMNGDLIAVNDGFSGLHDFFRWFNKDWEGKIIHFTDFRY